ncbi:nad p h oxidoreductase-related [Anaeramoeba flamelloides]|uniref:Nad p h oxidoreductase-related n=2 Tax=Anaeramoeba flamelloides TaxID=1746091 RepID=A0ABQ8X0U2_9EUKA|nr:nad p h oxidoreductase-related [Anaeramoeba flamelloides]
MKVFIVFAHPEPKSFNGTLLNETIQFLTEKGNEVRVSNLYEFENGKVFKAVLTKEDYTQLQNKEKFIPELENESESEEIIKERQNIEWSDLLIIVCPFWWFSLPAILLGWFDRVLGNFFFFSVNYNRNFCFFIFNPFILFYFFHLLNISDLIRCFIIKQRKYYGKWAI